MNDQQQNFPTGSMMPPTQNFQSSLPQMPKNNKKALLIVFIVLGLVAAGVIYLNVVGQWSRISSFFVSKKIKNLGDVTVVLSSLKSGFSDIESVEFEGSVRAQVVHKYNEDISSSFTGKIIFPQQIHTLQRVERANVWYQNDPAFIEKYPKIEESYWETIITDKGIFEKFKDNKWTYKPTNDPLKKAFSEKTGVEVPDNDVKEIIWPTLYYTANIEYLGQENRLHHYKVIPKSIPFWEAQAPIRNLQINFGINAWATNGTNNADINGEIWMNDDHRIIKEKYKLVNQSSYSEAKEIIEIEISYSKYDTKQVIVAPIDTNTEDEALEKEAENIRKNFQEIQQQAQEKARLVKIVNDLAQLKLSLNLYFEEKGELPPTLKNLFPSFSNDKDIENRGFLYSYYPGRKTLFYHIGVDLGTKNYSPLDSDSDFNSRNTGFTNGFNGADPIYDIVEGVAPINPFL